MYMDLSSYDRARTSLAERTRGDSRFFKSFATVVA